MFTESSIAQQFARSRAYWLESARTAAEQQIAQREREFGLYVAQEQREIVYYRSSGQDTLADMTAARVESTAAAHAARIAQIEAAYHEQAETINADYDQQIQRWDTPSQIAPTRQRADDFALPASRAPAYGITRSGPDVPAYTPEWSDIDRATESSDRSILDLLRDWFG